MQAGFSASAADIDAVKWQGYAGWLDAQLALPLQTTSRYDWMVDKANLRNLAPDRISDAISSGLKVDGAIWCKLISSPDQVRQRMALALSEIFVASLIGIPGNSRFLGIGHYADLLERHAFGNYRQLLEQVSLSVAMGSYLNMMGNRKGDPVTGRAPDENYAREIMQLFSIGLVQLNPNGTPKLASDGKPIESYSQNDVTQLARVLTGWQADGFNNSNDFSYVARPMKHNAALYEEGDKTVLGVRIPGSLTGPQALSAALDILANHPNVGPFIGRQLIQRFVKSHPSPGYVARVAAAFNNNGQGVRGDLKATLRAVLLDPEARAEPTDNASGRLREPIQRFIQWARTFGLTSKNGDWPIGDTSDPATRLGQSPMRSPSVFNFFRPGYVPPGNELATNNITAPEFQLYNETSVAGYLNYMVSVITDGIDAADMVPNYSEPLSLASNASDLLAHLNERLAAGAIDSVTLAQLSGAVGTIAATTDVGKLNRVRAAILLVMAAPAYLIQK
jgi:uncharacterized protein (DUF1800 family)